MEKKCEVCGLAFNAKYRAKKVCSNACRYKLQQTTRLGALNGRWKGGPREKACQYCGKVFCWSGEPHVSWLKKKFCSKPCFVAGQKRLYGKEHPNFNPEASKRSRGNYVQKQGLWSSQVRSRDNFTCRHCGKRGGDLHAHHLLSWKDYPDKRFDVDNGLTLCASCHRAVHSISGKSGEFGGSPERTIPSQSAHVSQ